MGDNDGPAAETLGMPPPSVMTPSMNPQLSRRAGRPSSWTGRPLDGRMRLESRPTLRLTRGFGQRAIAHATIIDAGAGTPDRRHDG